MHLTLLLAVLHYYFFKIYSCNNYHYFHDDNYNYNIGKNSNNYCYSNLGPRVGASTSMLCYLLAASIVGGTCKKQQRERQQ